MFSLVNLKFFFLFSNIPVHEFQAKWSPDMEKWGKIPLDKPFLAKMKNGSKVTNIC